MNARVIVSALSIAAAMLCALPAAAQSVECNNLTPASVNTKNPPAAYQVCWSVKDDQGAEYTAAEVTAMKVLVGGALVKTVPNPLSIAQSANAAGLRLFTTPSTGASPISKGDKTVTFSFMTVDGETEQSAPYSFRVVGQPAKPVAGRVVPS